VAASLMVAMAPAAMLWSCESERERGPRERPMARESERGALPLLNHEQKP
jgi:hypothetical protein